jgi:hypothetical protein
VVRLPQLCACLFRCRSPFGAFVLHVHSGVRGCDCVDDLLCHREESGVALPVPEMREAVFPKMVVLQQRRAAVRPLWIAEVCRPNHRKRSMSVRPDNDSWEVA